MNIIDQFVNALENDQLEQMNQKLFHLGERHHIYRAKKDYFSVKKNILNNIKFKN